LETIQKGTLFCTIPRLVRLLNASSYQKRLNTSKDAESGKNMPSCFSPIHYCLHRPVLSVPYITLSFSFNEKARKWLLLVGFNKSPSHKFRFQNRNSRKILFQQIRTKIHRQWIFTILNFRVRLGT